MFDFIFRFVLYESNIIIISRDLLKDTITRIPSVSNISNRTFKTQLLVIARIWICICPDCAKCNRWSLWWVKSVASRIIGYVIIRSVIVVESVASRVGRSVIVRPVIVIVPWIVRSAAPLRIAATSGKEFSVATLRIAATSRKEFPVVTYWTTATIIIIIIVIISLIIVVIIVVTSREVCSTVTYKCVSKSYYNKRLGDCVKLPK